MPVTSHSRTESSQRLLAVARHGEVAVRWVRDRRARRLRLSVSERGVRLTLPWLVSEHEAMAFVTSHSLWLSEQLDRLAIREEVAALRIGATTELPLRGMRLPVCWSSARFARLQHDEAGLCFQMPDGAADSVAIALWRDFLQAQARADVGRWLPTLIDGLPRTPSRFKFSPLGSLWGALNPSGMVSLDLALVLAPPAAFRYVLVHELCHLIQPNHSRAFWREVDLRCVDWREQRRWLQREGLALKRELAMLLGG